MCPKTARMSLEEVRVAIDAVSRCGHAALKQVAAKLDISARTLQRDLADRGVTYSELVESVLYERACRNLRQPNHNIGDISRRLGYRDASNFSRAFQRWSGQSPRAWRKRNGMPPSE